MPTSFSLTSIDEDSKRQRLKMYAIKPDPDAKASRKNGRMGNPKVRTGCITCKLRRIKCDEGKPYCGRCTSTGRQCDGYSSRKKRDSSQFLNRNSPTLRSSAFLPMSLAIKFVFSNPLPKRAVEDPDVTSQELRSLEFFRCTTAAKLSGWLTESFWKYQIPQTGHYEPSLRHAMIAIATIHEQFMILNSAMPGDPRLDPVTLEAQRCFADRHHNMAISELSKMLAERPEETEIALINCILFVMIDFVRGNFATAVLHLHSGMEILGKWRKQLDFSTVMEGSLEANIIQVFHHLSFHTEPSEYHLTDETPDCSPDPTSFTDLFAARKALEHLSQQGLRLIRLGSVSTLKPQDFSRMAALERDVEVHRARLDGWSVKLDILLNKISEHLTPNEREDVHELRVMHVSALMWLVAGLGCTSLAAQNIFDTIVDLADALHSWRCHRGRQKNWTTFAWEAGILPPVCFVAAKCEDPKQRRRAVALLMKTAPYLVHDEGLPCFLANTASDTMILREEKTAADKKIAMEVKLEPNTQQVDLVLTPGEDGQAWEVKKNIMSPAGFYESLC